MKKAHEPDANIRIVSVFETADPALMAVAESLLNNAGIEHTVKGESNANMMGWGDLGFARIGLPEIQVRDEDAERARKLLAALKPRAKRISS